VATEGKERLTMSRRAKGTYDTVDHWVSRAELRLPVGAGRALRAFAIRHGYKQRRGLRVPDLMILLEQSERTCQRAVQELCERGIVQEGPGGWVLSPKAREACEALTPKVRQNRRNNAALLPQECRNNGGDEGQEPRQAKGAGHPEGLEGQEGQEGTTNPPSPLKPAQAVIPFKPEPDASPAPTEAAPVHAPAAKRRRSSKGSAPAAPFPEPSERLAAVPGFLERWADWQVALEERRAPMKPTTAKHQLRLLEAASDPVAMLDYSLNNQRYTALYADRGTGRTSGQTFGRNQRPQTTEDANEALKAEYERTLLAIGGGHAA
jgi:hypothetical protein